MSDIFDDIKYDSGGDIFDNLTPISNEKPPSAASQIGGTLLAAPAIAGAGYGAYKLSKGIGRGMGKIGSGLSNLPKVLNTDKGADFAQEIIGAFVKAHSDKISEFGGKLDELASKNPDKQVSLQNVASELDANWAELPNEVKNVVRKTPHLRGMGIGTKNIKKTDLSLKQSQEVINYINTKIPKNIRANNLDVIDTVNNIKGAQLEAFPEMDDVRKSYEQFIKPYNNVKQYFKFNKLLNGIKSKFGGAQGQNAVEKILPRDVIKKLGGYRAAAKLAELPGGVPIIGSFLKSLGSMAVMPNMVPKTVGNVQYIAMERPTILGMIPGMQPKKLTPEQELQELIRAGQIS